MSPPAATASAVRMRVPRFPGERSELDSHPAQPTVRVDPVNGLPVLADDGAHPEARSVTDTVRNLLGGHTHHGDAGPPAQPHVLLDNRIAGQDLAVDDLVDCDPGLNHWRKERKPLT